MRICLLVVIVLVFSLAISSCQKELDPYTPQTGTDSTGIPVDTTGVDSSSAGEFQPVTAGSSWTYKDSASGAETTNSIGDSTKVINNILFRKYLSTNSSQAGWIASPGPDYYVVAQSTNPTTNTSFDLTFYYLNDTASAGSSFNYTAATSTGFAVTTKTTIVAKDLTVTVEGKTYTDVIQTHIDISYNVLGQVSDYGGYDYYMAKGIGFIKIRTLTNVNGVSVVQSCLNLSDYTIK